MLSLYIYVINISEKEYENCQKYLNSEGLSIHKFGSIFITCVSIRYFLRNGVKDTVAKFHSAGVNVVMASGDNIIKVTPIAKNCNILAIDVNLENLGPSKRC